MTNAISQNTYPAATQADAASAVRSARRELDQDAFLKILVSQLANQDPMSPMEDRDFIAQMAQFSTLEQIQQMNSGFSFSQACGLVGKSVYRSGADEQGNPQVVFGRVSLVLMRGGQPWLEVDGQQIPYDNQIIVYEDNPQPALQPVQSDQESTIGEVAASGQPAADPTETAQQP